MSDTPVSHRDALGVVREIPAGDTLWRERVQLLWRYVQQQETQEAALRKKIADQRRALADLQHTFNEWRSGLRATLTGAKIQPTDLNLNAREPGLTQIGDWRCGDTGVVRYAEHSLHPEWRVSIANGGALCSQAGGIEIPTEVFAWLIGPIVRSHQTKSSGAPERDWDAPIVIEHHSLINGRKVGGASNKTTYGSLYDWMHGSR